MWIGIHILPSSVPECINVPILTSISSAQILDSNTTL